MKRVLSLIACGFIAQSAFAAPDTQAPENVSVKIDFSYQYRNENGKADQVGIKNEMRMQTSQHTWTVIQNQPPQKDADRFVLLGKVDKADAKHISMSFMLIDAEFKKPSIISRPDLEVNYGQKGQIKTENMQLSVFTSV